MRVYVEIQNFGVTIGVGFSKYRNLGALSFANMSPAHLAAPRQFLEQAAAVSPRNTVVGSSMTKSVANASTGLPTIAPFLWKSGVMNDLGALGGPNSEAIWINDAGMIVGSADLPGESLHDAVVWKDGKDHRPRNGEWGCVQSRARYQRARTSCGRILGLPSFPACVRLGRRRTDAGPEHAYCAGLRMAIDKRDQHQRSRRDPCKSSTHGIYARRRRPRASGAAGSL